MTCASGLSQPKISDLVQRASNKPATSVYSRSQPTDIGAAPIIGASERARAIRRGGIALVANGAATGVLGLVFWVAAARLFGQTALGQNSSLIAAMVTVSGVAQLNFTRALSSLVPQARSGSVRLVGRVYLLVVSLSVMLGAIVAATLPAVSNRYSYLRPTWLAIPAFAAAVAFWSIFTLEDTVLASTRKAPIVPAENGFFGLAKLGLLFLLAHVGGGQLSIFWAWVLPLAVIVIPINLYTFGRALPEMVDTPVEVEARPRRWVKQDFAGYMFWVFGTSPLPFLVLGFLGPVKAAGFYLPLTVATAVDVVTLNIGNSITAEVTRNNGRVDRQAARFVIGYWLLLLAGTIFIVVFAPTVMAVFGSHYKSGSALVLRLLVGASAARASMFLMIALSRAEGRGARIALVQGIASIATLAIGLATINAIGAKGMALGWLTGSVLAGAISLRWLIPGLVQGLRADRSVLATDVGMPNPARAGR